MSMFTTEDRQNPRLSLVALRSTDRRPWAYVICSGETLPFAPGMQYFETAREYRRIRYSVKARSYTLSYLLRRGRRLQRLEVTAQ